MKLWILEKIDTPNGPWSSDHYAKNLAFIVRAEDELQAREFAQEAGGEEVESRTIPWITPEHSTCVELTAYGDPGYIMADYGCT